ncbi:MAG TPA: type II toxin-antitoxin system VapC family toxin [Thermoanaerobaculia bacterium]|nr:type II toxin-antitoxin system VapC family toxin [Thermoanaerobaculia bacterium]
MTLLVVDASVVVKWFIAEPNSEAALRLLDVEKKFLAPDHLFAETTNAVWKKVRRGEISREDGREALWQIDNTAVAIKTVPCLELPPMLTRSLCSTDVRSTTRCILRSPSNRTPA